MARQFERTVGVPVKYDMLYVGEWKQNLLLRTTTQRRVFLAGDSVHLVHPDRRIRMNTGIGDAVDLSWKLAGSLRGWGGRTSSPPTKSSAGRSAIAMSAPRAMPRSAGASGRPVSARDRDQSAEDRRRREHLAGVADIEQRKTKRDDRRGAGLPVCRLAHSSGRSRAGPSTCSRVCADHLAGRPSADMSGSTATSPCRIAWVPATRCFASAPRGRTRPRCNGPSRRVAPPSMSSTSQTTRLAMLRLRSHFAAAGPAHRLARHQLPIEPDGLAAIATVTCK